MDNNEVNKEITGKALEGRTTDNPINSVYGNASPTTQGIIQNSKIRERLTVPVGKRDYLFVLLTFLATVIFIRFSFFGGFNLGFTVSYIILFAVTLLYLKKKGKGLPLFPLLCGIFALLLSVPFTLYCDGPIKFISFVAITLLTALFFGGMSNSLKCSDGSYMLGVDALFILFIYPLKYLTLFTDSVKKSSSNNGNKGIKQITYIAGGVAITIPLLMIIVPLLMDSDAAFESLIEKIFGGLTETIVSVIAGLVLTPFVFICIFVLSKGVESLNDKNALTERTFGLSPVLINTVLIIISGCYAMYLLSQTAYFFSAFESLLPESYTAAEYARRGFFEMCAVAAINLCIFFGAYILEKRGEENRIQGLTKGLLTFLTVFTLVLIITSFSKMYMYIDRFGLTRLRVLTSCFMIMLFLVFVVLLLKLFIGKLPYMKIIIILAALTLCSISYSDIDTQIAKYNTNRYFKEPQKEIDIEAIYNLSEAKIPYLIELCEKGNKTVKKDVSYYLADMIYTYGEYDQNKDIYEFDTGFKFISYNKTRNNAVALIEQIYKKSGQEIFDLMRQNDEYYDYRSLR